MGFIRGFIVFAASFVLFFSLIAMNFFLAAQMSLDYNTLKPKLTAIAKNIIEKQGNINEYLTKNQKYLIIYCENNSDISFNYEDFDLKIPCEIVKENKSAIDYSINYILDEIYFKNYDCSFIDCFKKTGKPYFILSKHSRDYFEEKFYISLILSVLLFLIIFLFSKSKSSSLVLAGILLIMSSLPFAKLDFFASFLPSETFFSYIKLLFADSSYVFYLILSVGISLVILGILLKFFKLGIKLSNLINKIEFKKKEKTQEKDKENEVKEQDRELEKEKGKSEKDAIDKENKDSEEEVSAKKSKTRKHSKKGRDNKST